MSVESAADSVLREILRTAVRRNRSPREYPKMAAGDTQEPCKLTAWRNRKWGCRRRESESANREIAWISTGGLLSPSCSRRLKWGAYEILKSVSSHLPPTSLLAGNQKQMTGPRRVFRSGSTPPCSRRTPHSPVRRGRFQGTSARHAPFEPPQRLFPTSPPWNAATADNSGRT